MFPSLHRRAGPAALLFGIALLVWGSCPASADAQTQQSRPDHLDDSDADGKLAAAERDRQARDKFQAGRKAYDKGDYRNAWDLFRQAYVLSRRPALLYNVGQSADRLGLSEEALKAFKMYLRDAKDADNRLDVENRIRALEATVQRNKERRGAASATQTAADDVDAASTANDGERKPGDADEGRDGSDGSDGDGATAAGDDDSGLPPVPGRGQPTRRDWYLRAALGIGALYDSVEGGGTETTISGGGVTGELAVGYRVTPEIVLGGGMYFVLANKPRLDGGGELDRANLVLIGPFIDYYLSPGSNGMHVQAGVGVGQLGMKHTSGAGDTTAGSMAAGGGGLFAGMGYEWPVHDEVAVGVLGRVILATMVEDDVHDHGLATVSVSCTATWY